MAVHNLEIGGFAGWARDRLRRGLGGGQEFRRWDAVNERLSASFWVRQVLVDPRVAFQPDPEGGAERQRSWVGIGAEFASCEQTSSGAEPTWRGALLWTVTINGAVVGVVQAGSVEFSLPGGGEEGFEAPSEMPAVESAPEVAAPPAPKKMRASDTLLDGLLSGIMPGAPQLLEQAGVYQLVSDAAASIFQSFAHAPDVLGEFWADIRDHLQEFLVVTQGLIAAEVVAGILIALPDPTMASKLIAAILQALIIVFLIYVAATEGKEAIQHGQEWWRLVKSANGDPKIIDRAALEFMRTVFHTIMAVGAAVGLRAKAHGPLTSADVPAASGEAAAVKVVAEGERPVRASSPHVDPPVHGVPEGERPVSPSERPQQAERPSPEVKATGTVKAPRTSTDFLVAVRQEYASIIEKYENVPKAQSTAYQPLIDEVKMFKKGELKGNKAKIRELQDRLVETARGLGKGDEVYELRKLYDDIEKKDMPTWLDRLAEEGASKEERARLLHMYRSEARGFVRQLGTDSNATEVLYLRDQAVYGRRTGPTFEDLMQEYLDAGLTPEEAWDEIIKSAQRSNEDMNRATGIQSGEKR